MFPSSVSALSNSGSHVNLLASSLLVSVPTSVIPSKPFFLWGNGGPNWCLEYKLFSVEEAKA